MSYSETTEYYDLPQYQDNDRPTWRGDVNNTNQIIDAALHQLADAIGSPETVNWDNLSGKPNIVAAGNTAAEARGVIGAGVSNLIIGTTEGTAADGARVATDSNSGMVRLSTQSEGIAGTLNTVAITPEILHAVITDLLNVKNVVHTNGQGLTAKELDELGVY